MQEARKNCFGSKKCSTILLQADTGPKWRDRNAMDRSSLEAGIKLTKLLHVILVHYNFFITFMIVFTITVFLTSYSDDKKKSHNPTIQIKNNYT